MSPNLAAIGYLVAAVCFIFALRGLSSPATSRAGNRYGMAGMTIAILVTLLAGLATGKAWERYKLVEGRWIDRRRVRQSPHFILGLNYLVAGQVDLAIDELERAGVDAVLVRELP